MDTSSSLPDWTFNIREVSAGAYKIRGKHRLGSTVEISGTDPEKLMEDAKCAAAEIDRELKRHIDRRELKKGTGTQL